MKPNILPLLVLIFLPSAFAGDYCKDLTDVVQHYEGLLQWKSVEEVDEQGARKPCKRDSTYKQVTKSHPDLKDLDTLKTFECASLATIESRIDSLENELSLIEGLNKLKSDIKENHKKVANPSDKIAKVAALNFVNGLNIAENLELLLANGGNMLKGIKGLEPDKRDTPEKVKKFVQEQCKLEKNPVGICVPNAFNLNGPALEALNDLIKDANLEDKATIESWTGALSIEKEGGGKYSFSDMAKELRKKLPDIEKGKLTLSKPELKVIAALEKFKDAKTLDLSGMKNDIKVYEIMQNYKFHVGDLKLRQNFEIQSKATLAWADIKTFDTVVAQLSPEQKKACEGNKSDVQNALACMAALKKLGEEKKLPATQKSRIDELYTAIKISENYLEKLKPMEEACLGIDVDEEFKQKGELTPTCLEMLESSQAEGRLGKLQQQLYALNALKDEIGKQNQEEMKVRNLALATLMASKECNDNKSQSVGRHSCTYEKLHVSPVVDILTSNVSDLMVIQKDLKPSVDSKWLCENEGLKVYQKARDVLCNKKPDAPVVSEKKKEDEYQAPVTPPDGGYNSASTDAAINGLGALAGVAVGAYFAPQPQMNYYPSYNPYMYNYSQYNYGYPVMGVSDQLLFNARYYGAYGFYMPTQGLQPYTSFGGMGTYSSAYPSSNKSPYFSQ